MRNQVWSPLINLNADSYYARIEMSQYGWARFLESGYMGIGPGNLFTETYYFTHNSFLSICIEYGIGGLLAWLSLVSCAIMVSLRGMVRNRLSHLRDINAAIIAILGGLIVGSFAIEIQLAKFLWLFIALAFAVGAALPGMSMKAIDKRRLAVSRA